MKTLTKIFMAVAVLVTSFACTTDVTEDLGVNLAGQTTLTLSLEESRTQLGEKADGVYPLYWSEGDQISVNGVASDPLTAGGSAKGVFTFNGTLEYPYSVVYPAAAANQVTFLANQTYTPGTFCAGAAPMYGYAAAEGDVIQMYHLVGALRIAVAGEGTLSKAVVKAENGNLAGTYTIDCATGALTAKSGTTSNAVLLSFGEGLALDAEATPIYVAVPAGEYGKVTVTLYSTDGKQMRLTFDTTGKPITAGAVREFQEVTFAGEDKGLFFEGDVVITTAEQLVQFSAAAEANELSFVTSVTIGATIDMSGIEWNSIKNLPAITFDGGSDKGYEIKGLSAPFFYTLDNVDVKNLKLTDVDIKITEPYTSYDAQRIGSGAIGYYALDSSFSNCYTSGNIEVNTKFNEAATTLGPTTNTVIDISGFIGYTSSTTFKNVTNAVDVTVKRIFDTSNDNKSGFYILVGGIASVLYDIKSLENVYNYGNINLEFETPHTSAQIRCGGISAYTPKITSFKNVENHGDITVSNYTSTGSVYIAGLIGLPYTTPTFDTCKNSGAITINAAVGGNLIAGSIGGSTENSVTLKNCTVTNNSEGKGITLGVSCGKLYTGIIGYIASSTTKLISHSIENCTNSSDLTLTSDFSSTSSTYATLGFSDTQGSSFSAITMTDFTASGDIIINGTVANLLYVGGLYGYMRSSNNSTYSNVFTNCTYSGDITMIGSFANRSTIGGIVGYNSANYFTLDNCHMTGNITVQNNYTGGDVTNYVGVGGLIGYDGQEINLKTLCTNSGDIAVSGNCKSTNPLVVGGIWGWSTRNEANRYNAINAVNSGNITIGKQDVTTTVNNLCVGGVAGKIANSKACTGYENAVNTGNITIVGEIGGVTDASYVGGIAGYTEEPIVNASAYCAIIAPGFKTGWITGVARTNATLVAKNCKIGGTVIGEYNIEDETYKEEKITETNFFNYIYGSGEATDWTGTDNYDGCSCLSAKPE